MADFVDVMLRKCEEALVEVEGDLPARCCLARSVGGLSLYDIRTVVQDCRQSALDGTASRIKDEASRWSRHGGRTFRW